MPLHADVAAMLDAFDQAGGRSLSTGTADERRAGYDAHDEAGASLRRVFAAWVRP